MAQKGFDVLREATDSRYRLSMVVGRRAAQLKKGVPSTVTGKVLTSAQNSVTEAMRELEVGSGVVWGDTLPSFREINSVVEHDQREQQREVAEFSITRAATAERETATASLMGQRGYVKDRG